MQAAEAKLISSGTVRCSRQLTRNGSVVVYPNQKTDPSMVIARRKIWRKHFTINLFEALDLPSHCKPREYLVINEGDFVSVNETIAKRTDRKNRTLTAKASGRFIGISSGNLIFESNEEDLEAVSAGFPGMVTEVIPNRGAYIETNGAYIKGIWGNGKSGQGILLTVDDIQKDGIFTAAALATSMSGSILYANTCLDPDVLRASVRLSPGGLIFGSLPSDLLEVAGNLPFPIIVTDSFGPGRLSDPVYEILGDNIIKCAYIYSEKSVAEIIIPMEESADSRDNSLKDIVLNTRVRILDGFYAGEIGFVSGLLPKGNGDQGDALTIDDRVRICLDADTEVVLPVSNIEIVRREK